MNETKTPEMVAAPDLDALLRQLGEIRERLGYHENQAQQAKIEVVRCEGAILLARKLLGIPEDGGGQDDPEDRGN